MSKILIYYYIAISKNYTYLIKNIYFKYINLNFILILKTFFIKTYLINSIYNYK